MKEVKILYEFKHNFYDNLSIAMERKNMNCKALSRATRPILNSDDLSGHFGVGAFFFLFVLLSS